MSNDVKIEAISPRVRYIGDGMTTIFSFLFPVFEGEDLDVYLSDQLQTSGYKIKIMASGSGGEISFDLPPERGVSVTIIRNLEIKRTSDFQEGGAFRAKAINHELDYQMACVQQLQEQLDRSITFPPYSVVHNNIGLPEPQKGRAIIWDNDESKLRNSLVELDAIIETLDEAVAKSQNLSQIAERSANSAVISAEEAASLKAASEVSAEEARQWAIGDLTGLAAGSAEYWAQRSQEQAQKVKELIVFPLGTVVCSNRLDVPAGMLVADGGEWTKEAFPDFYQMLVDGNLPTKSYDEWLQIKESDSGIVSYYGLDEENERFGMISLAAAGDSAMRALVQAYTQSVEASTAQAAEFLTSLQGKLDVDMGNMSQAVKSDMILAGMPDPTRAVSRSGNVNYVADKSGYVFFNPAYNSGTSSIEFQINGKTYFYTQGYSGSDYNHVMGGVIPIARGTKYKIVNAAGCVCEFQVCMGEE